MMGIFDDRRSGGSDTYEGVERRVAPSTDSDLTWYLKVQYVDGGPPLLPASNEDVKGKSVSAEADRRAVINELRRECRAE